MKLHAGEAHAEARLWERYGLPFTAELKAEIVREIKRANRAHRNQNDRKSERRASKLPRPPRAILLNARRERHQKWKVDTSRGVLLVIYDRVDCLIVTFLPRNGDHK
ncbi:hypothetical protein T8K17_11380 [Thalassobaculum sp. OXR-137]|uniref:hypothetical protein n=1 Tax=Thalassobaculum sp. OXR-137 TaxID=3100173 RepID=UPI002AC8E42C|nr:hypothetical protein [Thalassobaculum sp. OXR-137]WPZ36736.1 hypothetical protein T8K17_11380 [Thalassobaculum sp. OXR-137]